MALGTEDGQVGIYRLEKDGWKMLSTRSVGGRITVAVATHQYLAIGGGFQSTNPSLHGYGP